jgi:hypothetical protein
MFPLVNILNIYYIQSNITYVVKYSSTSSLCQRTEKLNCSTATGLSLFSFYVSLSTYVIDFNSMQNQKASVTFMSPYNSAKTDDTMCSILF